MTSHKRAPATLLELAIAASLAVVPLLLVMLLLTGSLRGTDATPAGRVHGDRHVSVRQVAALKTLEHAVVLRSRTMSDRPTAQSVVEGVPACREEWSGGGRGLRGILPRWGPGSEDETPAQRIAARLATLDEALAQFSARENRRVADVVRIDPRRWFEAASVALETPVQFPDYPGVTFRVRCADLAGALALLVRSDARILDAFAWRGTETATTIARWRPDQYVGITGLEVSRTNPWGGLPGCVYFGKSERSGQDGPPAFYVASSRGNEQRVCTQPAMFVRGDVVAEKPPLPILGEPDPTLPMNDSRWNVPPSVTTLLQPLETLRRPSGSLYRQYTNAEPAPGTTVTGYRYGPNQLKLGDSAHDVGFSIELTIDPVTQALAQKIATCYTGAQSMCSALRVRRAEDGVKPVGHRLLEEAVVRVAAIAIIDVASGRIEALAGALSPCTRQAYDGPGRTRNCDNRLPYPVQYRPDALLNAAVYHDAMPASVIKPVMAAAFLMDGAAGAKLLATERADLKANALPRPDGVRAQLMRSASARFLDRMFCAESAFAVCARPWRVQAAAFDVGWNGGCAQPREACGRRDLLFGRAIDASAEQGVVQPLANFVSYGRLLAEPTGRSLGGAFRLMPSQALDASEVRRCALGADGQRPSNDDWEKCSGAPVVDVVAEGWGQGQARSSALGVAGMLASIAASANGQTDVRQPHLVHSLRGVRPSGDKALESAVLRWSLASPVPNRVPREVAEVILSGLSYSHRAGTARLACEQVFDSATCRSIDWIAGKTGTPTFPNDGRTLNELARLCASGSSGKRSRNVACGALRPYKWYVAAYRTQGSDVGWTKVIGVLTERNWLADSGRIHGAGDAGPNPAAEIAFQVVARQRGTLTGATP